MINKFRDSIKHHFAEVVRTKQSPKNIALGGAIGTFIAVLPTPGFGILFGVLITLIFKKISKYALFVALAVFNPFIIGPLYFIGYTLGNNILGDMPERSIEFSLANSVYEYSLRLLLGNFILAIIISSIIYLIVYVLVKKLRKLE